MKFTEERLEQAIIELLGKKAIHILVVRRLSEHLKMC